MPDAPYRDQWEGGTPPDNEWWERYLKSPKQKARAAVIEAAKAKVATFGECPTALLEPEDADLRTAVEAIEEVGRPSDWDHDLPKDDDAPL